MTPTTPTVRRKTLFAIVAAALIMLSLDGTIVATALHALQTGLDTSPAWAGWTITAYSLGIIVMLPLAGNLSDHYGRRRVFLASIAAFTLASLLCALATNIYLLILLRFLQAVGGSGIFPSATGLIVEYFGEGRDKAIGLFGSIFPIGMMVGPTLGGLFVTHASWQAIFLVNVPIGLVIIPLCLRFVPADEVSTSRPARLDVTGLVLLGGALTTGMTAMSLVGTAAADGVWKPALLLLLSLVATTGFVRHLRRAPNPIIEPRLVWGRGFGAVNLLNVVSPGAVAGLIALIPFYATTRYGIDALGAGLLLVAESAAVTVASFAASLLIRRTGYHRPLYVGLVVIAVGLAGLAVSPVDASPWLWLTVAAGVIGAGAGWMNPASRNAGLQLAPQLSASIAAMRDLGRQSGLIAAVSIGTAVIAAATDPASAQTWFYALAPVVLLLALFLVPRVPDHRGAW